MAEEGKSDEGTDGLVIKGGEDLMQGVVKCGKGIEVAPGEEILNGQPEPLDR